MSRFHQLSRGKIGSGPGIAPPSTLAAAATRLPSATIARSVVASGRIGSRSIEKADARRAPCNSDMLSGLCASPAHNSVAAACSSAVDLRCVNGLYGALILDVYLVDGTYELFRHYY